jgi:N6-L-threonylcarbamoyladenine synthase
MGVFCRVFYDEKVFIIIIAISFMVIVLGIESTAHTFGIGIVSEGKILANCKRSFTTTEGEGGMIPLEVAKHHAKIKENVYLEALEKAEISEKEIDVLAFSQGPGLAPCLLEGLKFVKELSKKLKKPVVGVNHCVAHLEIGETCGAKNPVMLYVSGANTQIIAYEAGKYRIFGETLDLGVGNFIDTIARYAGLGFPGGPKIQKIAEEGKKYIELPYSIKGMDIALSGIQTKIKQLIDSKKYRFEDLAYSLQETVFSMLIESAERALAHTEKKELLLGGGVGCNSKLQKMCEIMCSERIEKTNFFVPERSLLVDNAGMIAYLGEKMFKKNANVFSLDNLEMLDIAPRERTDEIDVSWR